jgi:hypothetical protein
MDMEQELIDTAKRMVKTASDPLTAIIKFLHERPENQGLPGNLVNKILLATFESPENIPGLVRILASHMREVCRHKNVIELVNEHPAAEKWGSFIIKQKERIKFEVAFERGRLVLNNIHGLIGVEHGVECPLEKILVVPPKLIVTVRLGLLHPQKEVDLCA